MREYTNAAHNRAAMDHYEDMDSPIGRLRLIGNGDSLVGVWFEHGRDAARGDATLEPKSSPVLARTRR